MKFYVSSAFLEATEIVEIARAADDLGYEGMAIPDHVVNLETLATPYPYTEDGQRRWQPFTDWLDPWVLVGALAQVTSRLKFVTTVYIPAMRDPYSAAKAIGTAACLSGGRVELGIGVGWCEEEFDLLGQSFAKRGKRTGEMLGLMKKLWEPGRSGFDGEVYQAARREKKTEYSGKSECVASARAMPMRSAPAAASIPCGRKSISALCSTRSGAASVRDFLVHAFSNRLQRPPNGKRRPATSNRSMVQSSLQARHVRWPTTFISGSLAMTAAMPSRTNCSMACQISSQGVSRCTWCIW